MKQQTPDVLGQLRYLIREAFMGNTRERTSNPASSTSPPHEGPPTQKSKSIFSAPTMAEQHRIEKFESESFCECIVQSGAMSDKKKTSPFQNLN